MGFSLFLLLVCPKGFTLPTSSDYSSLTTTYHITNNSTGSTKLRQSPLDFVYTGYYGYSGGSLDYEGSFGLYWSRTAGSGSSAYDLYFNISSVDPQDRDNRGHGFALRCVGMEWSKTACYNIFMAFAKQNFDFSYWKKQTSPLFADLAWNIPEQKNGRVGIIGGNAGGFHGVMKLAESLTNDFPLRAVDILLPDALRGKVPSLPSLEFAPSTESGSFAKSTELSQACLADDLTVLAGDFSRNSATAAALSNAIREAIENGVASPLLVMRDSVDLLSADASILLGHPKLILIASMAQLQRIFRAVYYPRMLMLSQSLVVAVETLHKFTLSYPATILTFHEQQIIVAEGGQIVSTPLEKTKYSVLELWSGGLAAKVAGYNLYNPGQSFKATAAAILA